jgi:hypothetical protein
LAPKHFRGGKPSCTAADDNNLFGRAYRASACLRSWPFPLFAHGDFSVALLDIPAGNWVKRGRAEGFSIAQVEAGVMPGATHCVSNQETFSQGALVMCTKGTDREHLTSSTH